MKNLFNSADAAEILIRLVRLSPKSKAQWGKMSVSQMLAHCQAPLEVALGERKLKRTLVGMLFGRIARKQMISEKPFSKNLPTDPHFLIKNDRDFLTEFQKLETLIKEFAIADPGIISARAHPFFGKMTPEEWGVLQWKHLDHHLRQFNA